MGRRDPGGGASLSRDAPLASRDETTDEEQDYCANHNANEAGGFSYLLPSDRLTEIGCNEGTDDSQNGRQDKALRLSYGPDPIDNFRRTATSGRRQYARRAMRDREHMGTTTRPSLRSKPR
jgi:hypothetical protein